MALKPATRRKCSRCRQQSGNRAVSRVVQREGVVEQQEKIAMLCNRMEISDLLSRYCRGIDRLDKKLISDVYWPDAMDNNGVYNGPDRKSDVWGKSVSVRVDLGGGRIIKKKKRKIKNT